MDWIYLLFSSFIGYFIGSIPFCWALAKLKAGVDLREFGSTTVGARNAGRAAGKVVGFTGGILDISKGILTIAILDYLPYGGSEHELGVALAGSFVIAGHNYPIFLRFQGGRGVAASVGVCLYINFFLLITWAVYLFLLVLIVRYMPIAYSLDYILLIPTVYYLSDWWPYHTMESFEAMILMAGVTFFILTRQWENLMKIRSGDIKPINAVSFFKGRFSELMK